MLDDGPALNLEPAGARNAHSCCAAPVRLVRAVTRRLAGAETPTDVRNGHAVATESARGTDRSNYLRQTAPPIPAAPSTSDTEATISPTTCRARNHSSCSDTYLRRHPIRLVLDSPSRLRTRCDAPKTQDASLTTLGRQSASVTPRTHQFSGPHTRNKEQGLAGIRVYPGRRLAIWSALHHHFGRGDRTSGLRGNIDEEADCGCRRTGGARRPGGLRRGVQ